MGLNPHDPSAYTSLLRLMLTFDVCALNVPDNVSLSLSPSLSLSLSLSLFCVRVFEYASTLLLLICHCSPLSFLHTNRSVACYPSISLPSTNSSKLLFSCWRLIKQVSLYRIMYVAPLSHSINLSASLSLHLVHSLSHPFLSPDRTVTFPYIMPRYIFRTSIPNSFAF